MKMNIVLSLVSTLMPKTGPLNTPSSPQTYQLWSEPIGKIDEYESGKTPDETPSTLILFQDPSHKEKRMGYKDVKGNVVIPATFVAAHPFNQNGFANVTFLDHKRWHKINKKGDILYEIYFFDNGPDYVHQGLERCVKDGKMGFADQATGKIVISPRFDFAHPFDFNAPVTLVCQGCRVVSKCPCSIKPGEPQSDFSKAKWGLIDKQGHAITPCIFDNIDFDEENSNKVRPLILFRGGKTYQVQQRSHASAQKSYILVEIPNWKPKKRSVIMPPPAPHKDIPADPDQKSEMPPRE